MPDVPEITKESVPRRSPLKLPEVARGQRVLALRRVRWGRSAAAPVQAASQSNVET